MCTKFLLTLAGASMLFVLGQTPLHAQATVAATTCKDGTTSTAKGRGACSGHGGVQKAAAAPAKAAAAPAPAAATGAAPAGATAKCKDGTYSMAKHHQGACSKHGGVGEWMDKPST
ncbi:MAG: DUF3761 domain-containing protein [Steroidobacterales bacterium]